MLVNKYYYLTVFRIEGHTTWRTHLTEHEKGFEKQEKSLNFPMVTDKKTYIVDKVTGDITKIADEPWKK